MQVKVYGTQDEFDAHGARIAPGNTKVNKMIKANAGCLKTVYAKSIDRRTSRKCVQVQENASIDEIVEFSKMNYHHAVIVIHKPELHVHESAHYGMQVNPEHDEMFILKREQKSFIDEQVKSMHDSDACMWSYFGAPTIPPRTVRLTRWGVKHSCLSFFCGVMTLIYMAAQSGWPIPQLTDAILDGLDLTRETARDEIDRHVKRDDPFM